MAASVRACLSSLLLEKCDEILKSPELFLIPRKKLSDNLKGLTKRLYDAVKDVEKKSELSGTASSRHLSDALPELIVDTFDDEQIWQELELQNDAFHCQAFKNVSRLLAENHHNSKFALLPKSAVTAEELVATHSDEDVETVDDEEDDGASALYDDGSEASVDDDVEAMSDSSAELERTLDKKIAYDLEHGVQSDSDDEEGGVEGEEEESEEDEEHDEQFDDEGDDEGDEDENSRCDESSKSERPQRHTEVDDQFFRMAELEEFLQAEDNKEMRRIDGKDHDGESDEDEANFELFNDFKDEYDGQNSDDENTESSKKSARFLRYKDFFDPPRRQIHVEDDQQESSDNREVSLDAQWVNRHKRDIAKPAQKRKLPILDDDGDDNDNGEEEEFTESYKRADEKSTFEIRQEKLKRRIALLEESNLSAKPWQMLGEASSNVRPENSLLQEHLLYDHMTKQAPVITEETTTKLEDIIKRRIKDQIWDDVERKIKPVEEPFEYKKKIVLDQEKSKMSLAEIYEQEYVKQQQIETEQEAEEPKDHKEIKKNMSLLFAKLDALSNFHFVPKPARPELKIMNNLPAIMVEEVAPVSVSDATLLAPEEIKERPKGVEIAKSERTETDKKRERREKRVKQRAREKRREAKQKLVAKLNPGLGNMYSKMAAMKKLAHEDNVTLTEKSDKRGRNSLASSKNFFSQLQEEVKISVNAKKGAKTKDKRSKISASQLKL